MEQKQENKPEVNEKQLNLEQLEEVSGGIHRPISSTPTCRSDDDRLEELIE